MDSSNCGKELENTPEKKKGGKGKIAALIIVILLLLAVTGVAVWYFNGDEYDCKKNMKLAEEAFAAGQLKDAGEYYEAALEYDESLKDAYIKLADIAMQNKEYDSAIEILQKGLEKTKEVESIPELENVKTEVYHSWVLSYLQGQDYEQALAKAEEAYQETGKESFLEQKEEIYLEWSEGYIENRDYAGTMKVLKEGLEDTGSAALEEKIKEVKNKRVLVKEKQIDATYGYIKEYYYDSKGRMTEFIEKNNGKVFQSRNYVYDDEGNVIEYIETINGLQTWIRYEWTEVEGKKQCVSTYLSYVGSMIGREITLDGKLILDEDYNWEDESLITSRQYEYDEADNLVKELVVSEGKTTINRYEHTYDEAGNLRESIYLDEEDNILQRKAYDTAGNEIESVRYFEGELECSVRRTYDERGNMLTEDILSFQRYEEEDSHTEYVYDENNEVIVHLYIEHLSGNEMKYTYDRTREGNTETKKNKTYENGELTKDHVVYTTYNDEGKLINNKVWDEKEQDFIRETVWEYDEDGKEVSYRHRDYGAVHEQLTEYEYGFPE